MSISLSSMSVSPYSSVAQSCLTLCNPMNRSTPSLPVHNQLLEFTQTHVHRVGDAIQPSHPLLSASPAPNPSQHQGLFQWVSSSYQVAKLLVFQLQHQFFQWILGLISFRIDCFNLLAVQGTLKSLPLHHCLKASVLWHLAYGPTLQSVHDYWKNHSFNWTPKNWYFWVVVLEKTLASSWDSKEFKPVNPKRKKLWIFIGRTDAEAEAAWCKEPTHWKRPWCWERLRAGGEGEDKGWDGWMASLSQWTWVWANSGRKWRTRKPGMLWFMGLKRVGHDLVTEWQRQHCRYLGSLMLVTRLGRQVYINVLIETNGSWQSKPL